MVADGIIQSRLSGCSIGGSGSWAADSEVTRASVCLAALTDDSLLGDATAYVSHGRLHGPVVRPLKQRSHCRRWFGIDGRESSNVVCMDENFRFRSPAIAIVQTHPLKRNDWAAGKQARAGSRVSEGCSSFLMRPIYCSSGDFSDTLPTLLPGRPDFAPLRDGPRYFPAQKRETGRRPGTVSQIRVRMHP